MPGADGGAGARGKEEVRRNGGCVGELVKLEERFTNHERQEVSKEEEQEGKERRKKGNVKIQLQDVGRCRKLIGYRGKKAPIRALVCALVCATKLI